jgi:hypothetical protein
MRWKRKEKNLKENLDNIPENKKSALDQRY